MHRLWVKYLDFEIRNPISNNADHQSYLQLVFFKHFVGIEPDQIIPVMLKHKRPYMLWNPFMIEFHKLLYEKLATKLSVPGE